MKKVDCNKKETQFVSQRSFIESVRAEAFFPKEERASNEVDLRERREEKGVKKLSETGSSREEFGQEGGGRAADG